MTRRGPGGPRLVHVDEDLVVVDKPAGAVSAPGRGPQPYVGDLLRALPRFADDEPLRIVHRLDSDATGLLVYARTLAAQRALVKQFMRRRVAKTYLALVSGYVISDGEVDLRLYFDRRRNRTGWSARRGKEALTRYTIAERVAGHTLLECRPITGRTHQIRAHMAAIGHPLAVDPMYGGAEAVMLSHYKPNYRPSRRRPERPLIARLTLHAARLQFEHPTSGATLVLECPLPKDFRATVNQLSRLV